MPGKLASSGDAPPAIIVDSAPSGEDDPFMFFAGDPPMGTHRRIGRVAHAVKQAVDADAAKG
jgi:hypothetical protein